MTNTEKPAAPGPSSLTNIAVRDAEKLEPIFGRMDLAAILIVLLGFCLLVVTVVVMAAIELAKLISSLWSVPDDRWLFAVFGLAVIWVAARWKRLCIF